MEPNNNNNLSSYFHHFNNQHQSPSNGVLPPTTDGSHSHTLFPQTTATTVVPSPPPPSAVSSQSQLQKKKRGRPRKYSSPEQALAARKAATTSSSPAPPTISVSSSNNSFHSFSIGTAGKDFSTQFITVLAGEDVGQKIMLFMQQSRREICILSASGSISNASLSQPATSGGSISYEGWFEIISLNGSYIRNEVGSRSGGLSVCLSSTDGKIIGGGVGGPLKAAGPVQVVLGTFTIDPKKDASAGIKGDAASSKLPPPPVGESVSSFGFGRAVDSSAGNPIRGNEEHQTIGGSHFMIQQGGMQGTQSRPSDWGGHPDSRNVGFELTGRTGHGAQQSPDENGDYE
ncbi:putative PPC domain-containing protein [Lupinus albus]|uniref:AT-hook motif nuclear-localized protein n=1 Tax=Lupinus albus TaxID=3870 RepID=A0A6A4QDV7_LUPAL|nr:putative PPC domain-containing protein [Lupinus albus]